MLRASAADARLDPGGDPGARRRARPLRRGLASSLHADNLAALAALADAATRIALAALLIDPQTAGGLLAGVPAERAAACLAELRRLGYRAAEIGVVEPRGRRRPRVRLEPGCRAQAGCASPPSPDDRSTSAKAARRCPRSIGCCVRRRRRPDRAPRPRARARRRARRRWPQRRGRGERRPRSSTIIADSAARARPADAAIAAPRLQPDRHRAAHQSRPRAVARGGDRGRGGGDARSRRRSNTISRAAAAASATTMSRAGSTRLTGAEAALAVNNNAGALVLALNALADGKRDDRLARRADRDRRLVPPARHHGARRHAAARGRHHQPHPSRAISPPRSGRRPG